MDRRIPKDILYGELTTGSRPEGRPVLRYKDVCKGDMRAGNIDPAGKEAVTEDRSDWRMIMKACVQRSNKMRKQQWEEGRERRWQRADSLHSERGVTVTCNNCNRACRSRIGLYNHSGARVPLSPETDGHQLNSRGGKRCTVGIVVGMVAW